MTSGFDTKLRHGPDGALRDPITDVDEKRFPTVKLDRNFPPPHFSNHVVDVGDIEQDGCPIEKVTYLTIGGGVGSFIWVDNLVIRGAPQTDIASVGMEESPYGRCKRLLEQSQISAEERLRSDSGSTPDNIWGWPGYAAREILEDISNGRLRHALKVAGKIISEPLLSDSYTPNSGRVYDSLDREAQRIGWGKIARIGRACAIRTTNDGRYVAAYAARAGGEYQYRYIIGQYLHLAVGHITVRLLPYLRKYRENEHELERVVNVYEEHSYVYDYLKEHGGTVAVRGRGIACAHIIQRISEVRQHGADIEVRHLMRKPLKAPSDFLGNSRLLEHNWEIQPYNFPKAAWGGDLRYMMEYSDDIVRADFLQRWGGTTSSDRRDRRRIIAEGLNQGWYQIVYGSLSDLREEDNGRVTLLVRRPGESQPADYTVDFVIDATGVDDDLHRSPLLKDLIETYDLPLNTMQGLLVSQCFELQAIRQSKGRAYAVGAPTLGSYFAPVDSFLGLQYAAQQAIEDMRSAGAPNIEFLDFYRAASRWLRWARGASP